MSRLPKEFANPSIACTSEGGLERVDRSTLYVTLLSREWRSSTDGDLSTVNRELAIQLAKNPSVQVSVFLPKCSEDDKRIAARHKVQLIEAEEMTGIDPVDWLVNIPKDLAMDCIIGHGVHLGRQIPLIQQNHKCSSGHGRPPSVLEHNQSPFPAGPETPVQTYQTSHPRREKQTVHPQSKVSKPMASGSVLGQNDFGKQSPLMPSRVPHRLEKIKGAPTLTKEALEQKQAAAEQDRQKELEKKVEAARSKKHCVKELHITRETDKAQQQKAKFEGKRSASGRKREKAQAEIIAKQRPREEKGKIARNKAKQTQDVDDAVDFAVDQDETYDADEDGQGSTGWQPSSIVSQGPSTLAPQTYERPDYQRIYAQSSSVPDRPPSSVNHSQLLFPTGTQTPAQMYQRSHPQRAPPCLM